jgi:hypothetical protein
MLTNYFTYHIEGSSGISSFLNESTILITGGVTGLLFGLHPVHVESVAWVAERKDLLCSLFFSAQYHNIYTICPQKLFRTLEDIKTDVDEFMTD